MKADIFFRSEELPVQVRKFKDIHINAGNRTDAEPQELLKNGPAQTAKPYDDNMRLQEFLLIRPGKETGVSPIAFRYGVECGGSVPVRAFSVFHCLSYAKWGRSVVRFVPIFMNMP